MLIRLTIGYLIAAAFVFGWLAATFGLWPSLFPAAMVTAPVYFAWRMISSQQPVQQREYGYLSIVSTVAISATTFLVVSWYGAGMDRVAQLDREFRTFQRHLSESPEYQNVKVSCLHGKGGRVYMGGSVPSKYWHDRLIQDLESMVRNNLSGYDDGVAYPGKTNAGACKYFCVSLAEC